MTEARALVRGRTSCLHTSVVQLAPGLAFPTLMADFLRGEVVFAEEEGADFAYKLVSGAVRISRLYADGRRHVAAFHQPGAVFGLEPSVRRRFVAETLDDSRLAPVRRSLIDAAARRSDGAALRLWKMAAAETEAVQDHARLLARATASERVAAFVRELAGAQPIETLIVLPMSRTDIADYLGLTIETVSPVLNRFKRDRIIRLPSPRTMMLCDPAVLAHRFP